MNRKANIEMCFALFRCKQNQKVPATKHGYYDARKNLNINELIKPNFNVAIACRLSNIFVLDLDVDLRKGLNGIETIKNLERQIGEMPLTLTQSTPRGGIHLIFSDDGIIDPIGKIGKDCDIRWNGYILCEPSSINGVSYRFIKGIDNNGNITIAKLPPAWLDYINKKKQSINFVQDTCDEHNQRNVIDGDFKKMYDNCLFIKYCVDCAATLDEPSWHLFACVLNSLSNGEALFDFYSRPHPDYNPILVKKKFTNACKYHVTCQTIEHIFADCAFCKRNRKENYGK